MAKTAAEALDSFTITDIAVVDNETFAFMAQASNTHPRWKDGDHFPARLVNFNIRTGNWGWKGYDKFIGGIVAGGVPPSGKKIALFTNLVRQVVALNYKNGPSGQEEMLPKYPDAAGPRTLGFVGSRFYGVTYDSMVIRRNGPGDWERIHFEDGGPDLAAIDGYSETDIYVSGFDQALLHYDGMTWTKQKMPLDAIEENFRGMAIVCAPDGTVYVGGQQGQLLAGSAGGRWKLLMTEDEAAIGNIRAMTWFKGALYATSDYALYRLTGEKWERWQFPGSELQPVGWGHLDSNDNIMLLAGPYSAGLYDGEQWTPIHGDYDDLELLRLQLAEKLVSDLGDIRDALRDVARETGAE